LTTRLIRGTAAGLMPAGSSQSALHSSRVHHLDLHSFPTRRSSDLCKKLSTHSAWPCSSRAAQVHKRRLVALPRRRHPRLHVTSRDRKSTRLNSSHVASSYAVFCLKKKNQTPHTTNPRG